MIPLSELCMAIVDCEHKTAPKSADGTGYPLVRTSDIGRGRIDLSSVHRVDAAAYEAWTRRAVPQPGDLVLAREAPVGNVAIVMPDTEPVLGQRTVLIRPNEELVDGRYLTYRLLCFDVQYWMNAVANGATVPHLNVEDIRSLPIPSLPPLAKQQQIGTILSAFDDLIENNQHRIGALEAMVASIYREWFIHYRFPGHERVGLTSSELGSIPSEWEVCTVDNVAALVRGRSYRRHELSEEDGVPFLNLKCIERGGGFRKSGLKRYLGKYNADQRAYPGDTVIAVTDMTQERNIVGQAGRVPSLSAQFGVVSLDLARIVPSESTDPEYLYGMFRFSRFSETVREHANGTNVLHLSPERIKEYRFPRPPADIQLQYGDVTRPMLHLIDNLMLQVDALRETRDLMLPMLMSGEIDVSDLNLELEAVGV